MKKYLPIILFLLQYYVVSGQEQNDTITLQCTTVIAVNGLNIRGKPNKSSKIIEKIPFGKKITYLSHYSFGIDTIKDYPNLDGIRHVSEYKYEFTGKWAKINYNGKIGYVLDAYLFYDNQLNSVNREDNREYALLYSYSACNTNLYTPSMFHWYGLFKEDNNSFVLKKVNLNYFSKEKEQFSGKDIGISVGNDIGLIVIIGSKKLMKEGNRNCVDIDKIKKENDNNLDDITLKNYGIERLSTRPENEGYFKFILNNNKKEQPLNLVVKEGEYDTTADIDFIGDIDGDNKMDYILNFYGEEGYYVLYLSSEKKGDNIVEPIAYFYTCYCC